MFGSNEAQVTKAVEKKNEKKLLKLAKAKDKSVMLAAIRGLGSVQGEESHNFLIVSLRSPDPDVRAEAAGALGNQGNTHAHEFLSQQLKTEKDPKVIAALKHGMGKLSTLKSN